MTTEELNALIAQAEGGDVAAMNQLTHIYGEEDGFINYEQAARWFFELIKRDCDPDSGVYENTGFNKDLYGKLKDIVLNAITEIEAPSFMNMNGQAATNSSLFRHFIITDSPQAKIYIKQSEEKLHQKALRKIQLEKQLEKLEAEIPKINSLIEYFREQGNYLAAVDFVKKKMQVVNEKTRLERQLGVNN
jgi:hypothetical protein